MEYETLFTSSKWDILKCLESGKKSPIDLAKESNTSIANISQQLRLLELAGFVKSERISNREKGLPRILYSLAGNYSYIVVGSEGFVDKRFLRLDHYQKSILKIWFLEDKAVQHYIERFFWNIAPYIDSLKFVGLDLSEGKTIKAYIISDDPDAKKSLKDVSIEGKQGTRIFSISHVKELDPK